ncbi:hypothetical protein GSI_14793 [Ganoderma sinense ZZ0214-1]|uniref:Ribonucleotide reductase large subunit C-terminal domain-containing protein n=1 Tax=Ganoderma sinense ZZ0214-1 TaxID=1077348 RepID=A0A2G8RPP8_9APHY|nr:hypothetical protein GSI_14793 [Ganoderma sinense ZZ0214-1]
MRRLQTDDYWSLFNPVQAGSLNDLYSNSFDSAYTEYERNGIASDRMPARTLWNLITDAIRDSSFPFIMFSDNVNARNNQMHIGLVKASSPSAALAQFSSTIDTAVAPSATLCLTRYIRVDGTLDYDELHRVAKAVVRSLDRTIDVTNYPTTDAAVSAYRTRSIALGTQGLADVFSSLEIPFTSDRARALNKRIFETIYHAALEGSSELADSLTPYDAWIGSPAEQGIFQVDMWHADTSEHYNFDALRERIHRTGLRNSVITSQMSTTSTAHLFSNSAGVDPYPSNVLRFPILGCDTTEVVRPLVNALQKRGLWTDQIRADILASDGSVQSISSIPDDLKVVFLTAYELDQHDVISIAADRAPFIDQSQSHTLFVPTLTPTLLMDLQLHAWRIGLKTGAYYVQSNLPTDSLPFIPTNPSPPFSLPPAVQPVSAVSSVNATSVSHAREA